MSVYTPVEQDELKAFLNHYPIADLVEFKGISEGIENTNYFVTTEDHRFVLTLFECHTHEELEYFLDLMAFLAEHQVPSAHPFADREGHYLRTLKDKPAALVARLPGRMVAEPNRAQCAALGAALGHLHAVGQQFPHERDNDRGPHWWRETIDRLLPKLPAADAQTLQAELAYQRDNRALEVPRGVIHADLFRDNALWEGDRLTGIIDFYYACSGPLLYDVAVTINDWCCLPDGGLDEVRVQAFTKAYAKERPFVDAERAAWPVMLRAGALRFWLSRLKDKHFPREGELTHIKDPDVFKQILLRRVADTETLAERL